MGSEIHLQWYEAVKIFKDALEEQTDTDCINIVFEGKKAIFPYRDPQTIGNEDEWARNRFVAAMKPFKSWGRGLTDPERMILCYYYDSHDMMRVAEEAVRKTQSRLGPANRPFWFEEFATQLKYDTQFLLNGNINLNIVGSLVMRLIRHIEHNVDWALIARHLWHEMSVEITRLGMEAE